MQNYFHTQALGSNKRDRTRNLLIDSAIDVFADKGIEDAKIQEITASVGLSNGTFYNHFTDKDELARATVDSIMVAIAEQIDERMSSLEQGVQRVVVATRSVLQAALVEPAWAHVIVAQYHRQPSADSEGFRYLRADLQRLIAQRRLPTVVDDLLVEQCVALLMVSLRRMLLDGGSEAVLARTCEGLLRLAGLTPDQAQREQIKAAAKVPSQLGLDKLSAR